VTYRGCDRAREKLARKCVKWDYNEAKSIKITISRDNESQDLEF